MECVAYGYPVPMPRLSLTRMLAIIGPGLLVAATGVGAGDLATASFTGSHLGVGVLWVVLLGAFLKFILNEGLARWQLATGQTLLEGAIGRLGWPVTAIFLAYLLLWSYFVGSALASACGVAGHALIPLFDDPQHGKIFFGLLHSAAGVLVAWVGGFRLFSDIMRALIVVMFVTVIATAILLNPDWGAALRGSLVPTLPDLSSRTISWSAALMGGVGGTLTVLCYGYWIREAGRRGEQDLRTCRLDLFFGYLFTAIFGMAMVVIGSTVTLGDGKGVNLLLILAAKLPEALPGTLGSVARWVFLVGAWAAVFSSLLGVWQAVPYLFADFVNILKHGRDSGVTTPAEVDRKGLPYRAYLIAIATVPMAGLFLSFREVQMIYSVFGAGFMPMLALVLLLLTTRKGWIGERFVSRWYTVAALVAVLLIFAAMGVAGISE